MAYSIEMFNKCVKEWKNGDIKKMHLAKIKELRKNGFYMDVANPPRGKIATDFGWFASERKKMQGVDVMKSMTVVRTYDLKDGAISHEFIKVSPKGWTFTYVDNANAEKVLGFNASLTAMNEPFFGIYVKNESLKAHDVMQYDFTNGLWFMTSNTIFGGLTCLLGFTEASSAGGWCGTLGCHQGGVFESWEAYIDSFRKRSEGRNAICEESISELRKKLKELVRSVADDKKDTARKIKRLRSIKVDGKTETVKKQKKQKDIFPYYVCYYRKNGISIEAPNVYLTLDEAEDYAEKLRKTYGGKIDVERVEKGRRFIETVVL